MTALRLVDHIELDWHSLPFKAPPVQLKCPSCFVEFARPVPMAFDTCLSCPACHHTAEFRQFHESWCLGIRAELALNVPDLLWLMGEEILAPLCSTDAMEGDRRALLQRDVPTPAPKHATKLDIASGDGGRPARKGHPNTAR